MQCCFHTIDKEMNTTDVDPNLMTLPFESFVVSSAPEQREMGDGLVPMVLSPPASSPHCIQTVSDVVAFVKRHRSTIDEAVQNRGAVLFRGFPLKDVDGFDAFVQAWEGWNDLSYERSMSFAVRKKLSQRICTTNEGKSGGLVFHHEQAQTPLWPRYVFFLCQTPAQPGDGGATGVVRSDVIYDELKQRYPDFIHQCEAYGVRYTIYAGPDQDTSKGAGRSWKSFFHVETKEQCEQKMIAGGWDYQWGVGPDDAVRESDFLKCTTPLLEAVKIAPGTSRKCFFNQLIATTANALEFSRVGKPGGGYDPLQDIPTQAGIDACVRFGNGDSVPLDILLEAKGLCEKFAIEIVWQEGDVALLSNYLMMHARRPWNGPEGTRKVLASLVAEDNCTSFGKTLIVV